MKAMARLLFLQNLQYEYLGPMYIASSVRARGHESRLAFGRTADDFAPEMESFRPDVVGFSVMTGSHRWAVGIAREMKRRYGVATLFGGAHPTFFPDFANEEGIDGLVRGEGEEAATEILDRVDAKADWSGIANLVWKRDGVIERNDVRTLRRDLDDYPFPDRKLYDDLEGRVDRSVRTLITSRGCPFHCSFCFEDAMRDLYAGKGKYVRIRRIGPVIEECKELRDRHRVKTIYFADDVFGMSKPWLYEFMEVYRREVGVPFICLVRADIVASDPAYARHLKEGGCRSVFFGVESGNEKLRNRVLAKDLTDEQIVQGARYLHEAGIPFRTYNIVGLPDETMEDAFSTVELNIRIGADYPWCSVFAPYPGTALAEYAQRRGYLPASFDVEEIAGSFFTTSNLEGDRIRQKQNLQKFFQTAVRWPWTYPLVKKLITLPPNRLFDAWFGWVYFLTYLESEQKSFWKTLPFALRNYRHIFAKE